MKTLRWRPYFKRAWTMRYVIVAAVLGGAEVVIPLFSDLIPRGPFAALSFVSVVGAAIARYAADEEEHGNR